MAVHSAPNKIARIRMDRRDGWRFKRWIRHVNMRSGESGGDSEDESLFGLKPKPYSLQRGLYFGALVTRGHYSPFVSGCQ